jgi:hypothetical protein
MAKDMAQVIRCVEALTQFIQTQYDHMQSAMRCKDAEGKQSITRLPHGHHIFSDCLTVD